MKLTPDQAPFLNLREIRARRAAERRTDLMQMASDWIGGCILTALGVVIIYLTLAMGR